MRVLVAAVALAALVALGAWTFYFVGTSHPKRADAIVVLSGDLRRVPTAVQLFHEHVAPNLLVSLYDATPSVCGRPHVTCFRAHPFNTRGEAETASRLLRKHGWTSVIVVSSRYHLRRARLLFDRCTNASIQIVPAPSSTFRYVRGALLEIPKWIEALTLKRAC